MYNRVEYVVDFVSQEVDENCAKNILKSNFDLDDVAEGEFWEKASAFASSRSSVMSIPKNETKIISWKSAKFETGLPGYMWYWTLEVELRADSSGTGYEYVGASYGIYTVEQWWKILTMQYEDYYCKLTDYSCYYSTSSSKVDFVVSVVYDISYLLQNQKYATSYSVQGGDTHSVLLK